MLLNIKKENIKLIVYDFDGVMTDNKVYVEKNGNEMVQTNRADGLGVSEINKLGLEQIIISTETNPVVSDRAIKMGIKCLQGIENKQDTLIDFCQTKDYELQYVIYVGNDINDKEVMKVSGITFCPSDAHESIKAISDYVLKTKGGQGVIRELLDLITKKKGK